MWDNQTNYMFPILGRRPIFIDRDYTFSEYESYPHLICKGTSNSLPLYKIIALLLFGMEPTYIISFDFFIWNKYILKLKLLSLPSPWPNFTVNYSFV